MIKTAVVGNVIEDTAVDVREKNESAKSESEIGRQNKYQDF